MKKVDEIKYLAEWASWAKGENEKTKNEVDKETALVVTPKSEENLPAEAESRVKKSADFLAKNISLIQLVFTAATVPVSGPLLLIPSTLIYLCDTKNNKVKNGYKLLKAITAPIIKKQVSVVEHWMDDETKFFVNITMPLFVIIRDSQRDSKLVDYIKSIKNRREVKPSEYSSEQVYTLLQIQHSKDKSYLVLEEYIPKTSEYEELKRALQKKNQDRFIEKLPIHAKDREIYSFCYHYEELLREYASLNLKHKYGAWIAIRIESCRIDEQEKAEKSESTEVAKYEPWILSILKPELMENMREDTLRMLLYAQKIPLTKEQRKELDELMRIPATAHLYNQAMGVDCDSMPVDILFSDDLDESKRVALIKLIVSYLSEPTQTRKAKSRKGFTVQATAQKSVIALLIKTGCLHRAIDTFNATELHRLTTLFIEEHIGVDNVSYSSKYNEAKVFQDYNSSKLDQESSEYKRYLRFKDFERDFRKIIDKE